LIRMFRVYITGHGRAPVCPRRAVFLTLLLSSPISTAFFDSLIVYARAFA
jgi:hypothetical protein